MTILVTVQGNIGSGKSTLVNNLQQRFGQNKKICFLQEPVDIWNTITDENGSSMIKLYYSDQKSYAFSFQMMAYISRLHLLKQALSEEYDVIISERSLDTDKNVFAKMLYDDGKIKEVEYKIYMKWFEEFKSEFPEEFVVYVKTTPKISHTRVNKRAREGEIIPISYLENCHEYHEKWLNTHSKEKLLVLDGDIDICEQPQIMENWITQIKNVLAI